LIDPSYNPVIGYVLLDKDDNVMCPHRESFDPVLHQAIAKKLNRAFKWMLELRTTLGWTINVATSPKFS